jgi:hypothetical protein
MRFQGRKHIKISKCQIRTVRETIKCFPTEILQQLKVCWAVCGCELSVKETTCSLGRRGILSRRSFARFSARCNTCRLKLCVHFPGSPTAIRHRRPWRRWPALADRLCQLSFCILGEPRCCTAWLVAYWWKWNDGPLSHHQKRPYRVISLHCITL